MSLASSRPLHNGGPHSPTPTTASSMGYSAYAASSAPGRGAQRPPNRPRPSDTERADSRDIARVHWRALRDFLSSWLARESPTSRASAREKLTRLTKLQFQELSTDVYDELVRRQVAEREGPNGGSAAPFLPVRDDFHPKRNQARQKLATLPRNRFKDLSSDVFYELRRRYPEFEENEQAANDSRSEISFNDPPPAPGPVQSNRPFHQSSSSQSLSTTQPPMNRLASSSSQRSGATRSESREQLYANAAANEVVVPNKSRLKEEEIEVPYARESVVNPELDKIRSSSRNGSRSSQRRESREGSYTSGNHARTSREQDRELEVSPVSTEQKDYFDRMSFSSNLTSRSKPQNNATGWDEEREEKIRREYELKLAGLERRLAAIEAERDEARRAEKNEKDRNRDWEDEVRGLKERSATHATSLRSLQHELDLAKDSVDAARRQGEASARDAREETAEWRDRCAALEEEMRHLEDNRERGGSASHGHDEAVQLNHELQNEVVSLLNELKSLSIRQDEMQNERDQDGAYVRELEDRVADYKKKWETVRMELRNLKATSTMFSAKPVTDDHLPASADGNIADVNVHAFQAAIDTLLSAARSSTPTGVLPAMKGVVVATADISEDVKAFEANPNLDVDVSQLESLKHQSTSTLNGLMQAARNHAMSSGLSPVSLLDAAAGHVTANVVEIIKLLKIRRVGKPDPRNSIFMRESISGPSGKTERLRDEPMRRGSSTFESTRSGTASPGGYNNNYATSTSQGSRGPSRGMSFQSDSFELERKPSLIQERLPEVDTRSSSINNRISQGSATTSGASSAPPPAVFDTPVATEHPQYGRSSEASHTPEPEALDDVDDEKEWDELKPYLEKQSSALVNSIQNLLAAIRSGGQGPALNEHLSEVIAIGSSIVAVSTDSLPASLRPEGDGLLKDLVENTDKLSEAQSQPEFTKVIRQQIASASFGLAKSLKALMKLGT